ncbi:CHASE3 domain-containing protein [Sphingomonas rhizophila]|uniref:CHASE3 domain-containing protein n=1 Tax=Sphingomonas rhizophila TaxID=2071607 RepID=UPI001FE32CA1|nr:CHASE3 domain-containing protein [Sphingomonas rhizophila]
MDWRRGGAAAGGLIAALILLGMVFLVTMSNQARDTALDDERHTYDVTLLTRTLDATISRSEAALGRFVLDENVEGSGNIYLGQWRLAGQQIDELERLIRKEPEQRPRIEELQRLYQKRGEEFALAARATAAGRGPGAPDIITPRRARRPARRYGPSLPRLPTPSGRPSPTGSRKPNISRPVPTGLPII